MKYIYKTSACTYIVEPEKSVSPDDKVVKVSFIARVNGGKGRLPNPKEVDVKDLTALINVKTIENLYRILTEDKHGE